MRLTNNNQLVGVVPHKSTNSFLYISEWLCAYLQTSTQINVAPHMPLKTVSHISDHGHGTKEAGLLQDRL